MNDRKNSDCEKAGIGTVQIDSFLSELASKAPVPGGGGASALGGALGSCLGQMVGNLTVGKKKYAAVEEEMEGLLTRLHEMQGEFLRLAEADEEVFAPLAEAYRLPSETEKEREEKARVMEGLLLAASQVPLKIMELAAEAVEIFDVLAERGSRMAVSDAGVGVQFVRTALTGAAMNVVINTKSMRDRGVAEQLNARAGELLDRGMDRADQVYRKVLEGLKG